MSGRDFTIEVLKPDYSGRIGTIPRYQSASCTWQDLGVGTATISTPERSTALELLQANVRAVPVTFRVPGLPRWTGRVTEARGTKTTGQMGLIQATLVDEFRWMQRIILAPAPAQPWSGQSAASHDERTGALVTVAKAYVQAGIDRLATEGYPTPLMIVPTAGTDTSPTVTLRARNQTPDELLTDSLRYHGYRLTAELWLPGDPVPAGMTLTTSTVLIDVKPGRSRPYVRFTDTTGGVRERLVTASEPGSMGVVVGGPGELTARVYQKEMATDGRVAALGKWGMPEVWLDATDADLAATRTQRGLEKLGEGAGKASVAVEIDDGRPWRAGPTADYWVGDTVRVEFSGVTASDRIERITAADNAEGFRTTAVFGTTREVETADARVARVVSALAHRLAAMEKGR